jgi:hypothetical protein
LNLFAIFFLPGAMTATYDFSSRASGLYSHPWSNGHVSSDDARGAGWSDDRLAGGISRSEPRGVVRLALSPQPDDGALLPGAVPHTVRAGVSDGCAVSLLAVRDSDDVRSGRAIAMFSVRRRDNGLFARYCTTDGRFRAGLSDRASSSSGDVLSSHNDSAQPGGRRAGGGRMHGG